ncbi:MAG: bifunctional methylenetetrahydrofolate dehydrogenase/methenyltetrahydrofolate cyclohydrolase FolD [Candidatus Riflebacteria bacterium]|nr:bifunctional methylenetetrahydrofolate dehydrogenase/methenyltetrahydrofolate cyclohydrolase FolD [Candidatus Riflebacteria bacterium]
MATIINGKEISQQIRGEIANTVKTITDTGAPPPGLAVIIVGDSKASQVYVSAKKKACEQAGFYSLEIILPAETTQAQLLQKIDDLNNDAKIHGILIQLPLPSHINESAILEAISTDKDVDCFNPKNFGYLNLGADCLQPCTPSGALELLKRYQIPIEGKNALVVGRSNIVGKPMATLLTRENATVTIAHSRTKNLPELCKNADIIVAAIGKPEFIKGAWIKENCVVLDVGTNSVNDPTSPKGYKLVGDVEYEEAAKRASFITPVPGGVGPMTIAMLLSNTLKAREKLLNNN